MFVNLYGNSTMYVPLESIKKSSSFQKMKKLSNDALKKLLLQSKLFAEEELDNAVEFISANCGESFCDHALNLTNLGTAMMMREGSGDSVDIQFVPFDQRCKKYMMCHKVPKICGAYDRSKELSKMVILALEMEKHGKEFVKEAIESLSNTSIVKICQFAIDYDMEDILKLIIEIIKV